MSLSAIWSEVEIWSFWIARFLPTGWGRTSILNLILQMSTCKSYNLSKKKKSGSISWRWEASAQALWTQLCFLVSISTYKPKLFESHWNSTAIKSWGVNSTLPACKLQMSMLIEVCHSWQKKEILLHEAFIKANKPVNGHFSLETLQTPSCTRVSLSRRCLFWHSFFRSLVPDPV